MTRTKRVGDRVTDAKVKTTKLVIGTTLYVFVGTKADEPSIDRAVAVLIASLKPNGDSATCGDKTIWIEDVAVVDTTKSGSAQYTWDRTGNKVLHQRIQKTKICGRYSDAVDSKVYRTVWKQLD